MGNLKLWLPLLYLLIALATWINFVRLPPDGLASLGLWIVVLPIMLIDLAFLRSNKPGTSILLPDRFGYYANHAIFFSVSVALTAVALFALGSVLDRKG